MRISAVKITNFGSWAGEHEISMSGHGLVLVEGINYDNPGANSNGSGKSKLFEAVDWCLFGKVPSGDHVDSVINNDARKCAVEVWLDEDGMGVVIERTRKTGETKLKFRVFDERSGYDETVETLDVDETQRRLEQVLGLDRQVFHAAVLRGQSDRFNFADATQADRLDILTRILQLDEIDKMLEVAKGRLLAAETAADAAQHEEQVLAGKVAEVVSTLNAIGQAAAKWETDETTRIAQRVTELSEYAARLEQQLASPTIPELEARLAHLKQPLPVMPPSQAVLDCRQKLALHESTRPAMPDQAALAAEMKALSEKIPDATGRAGAAQAQVQQLRAKLATMRGRVGTVCPTCGQAITGSHLEQEITRLEFELASAEAAHRELVPVCEHYQRELAAAGSRLAQVNQEYDGKLKAWEAERAAIAAGLAGLEEADRKRDAADQQSQLLLVSQCEQSLRAQHQAQTYLAQVQAELLPLRSGARQPNPYTAQLAELSDRKLALEREQGTVAALCKQKQLDAHYQRYMVEALGPQGLKNYILDLQLQTLTDAANHWVGMLTGGSMMVQFVTQVALRSKKAVKNAVDIRVFRYEDGKMVERSYRSWSGGERQRISLGIDFGLAEMVARRATRRWDILILDELFRHLDRSGKEAVVGMLKKLRETKPDIFVVEHDPDFIDQFDHRVRVVKQGGHSRWLAAENAPSALLEKAGENVNAVPSQAHQAESAGSSEKPKRAASRRSKRVPVHTAAPEPSDKGPGSSA